MKIMNEINLRAENIDGIFGAHLIQYFCFLVIDAEESFIFIV